MAWLPMYATASDVSVLLSHLNESDEVAFVVPNSPGNWVAVNNLEALIEGRYCVWHIPSGPLPLFRGAREPAGQIQDPFVGWAEVKGGADPTKPYFGAGHPGVIWLNIHLESAQEMTGATVVGLSSFEWIGNHYKIIGSAAEPTTERFWKALGRWLKKHAVKVPRGGPQQNTPPEIWAFSGARAMFDAGAKGGNN